MGQGLGLRKQIVCCVFVCFLSSWHCLNDVYRDRVPWQQDFVFNRAILLALLCFFKLIFSLTWYNEVSFVGHGTHSRHPLSQVSNPIIETLKHHGISGTLNMKVSTCRCFCLSDHNHWMLNEFKHLYVQLHYKPQYLDPYGPDGVFVMFWDLIFISLGEMEGVCVFTMFCYLKCVWLCSFILVVLFGLITH